VENFGGENMGRPMSMRTVAFASFIGTAIEWYDFFLYGTAAAVVFGPLFFPEFDPLVGTLVAFGTFAVGYFARPFGGVIFGHFGDRVGRKSMLVLTLVLMGVATFLVGLLPTYGQVGIWAPLALLTLRIVQGIAVGGEWGGAVLMAVEHAPEDKRGFYGSFPHMGAPAGLLLSTGVFSLFATLPSEQFLAWGWRVPFLFSMLLLVVGLFIRLRIVESPAFARLKESQAQARMPILDVIRAPRNVLLIVALRFVESGSSSIFAFFASTYVVQQLGLPASVGLVGVTIAAAVGLVTVPLSGALSDRFGRRVVYAAAAVYLALVAFPVFWLMNTREPTLIWLALVVGLSLGSYMTYGPMAALFSELFNTRVRYTGASLGYQLGGAIATGLAPLVATTLLAAFGGASWTVSLFIVVLALVSLAAILLVPETSRHGVAEDQARTPDVVEG